MGDGLESGHAGGSRFSALSALYSAERAAELGDRKMFFDVLRVMLTVVAVTGVLGGSWGGVLPWYLYAMIGFCVLGLIAYLTQLLAVVKVRNVSVGILEEPLVRAALLEENRGDVGSRAIQGVANMGAAAAERRNVLLFALIPIMYLMGIVVAYAFVFVCLFKLWAVGGDVRVICRCVSVIMGVVALYVLLCMFVVVAAFADLKMGKFFSWRH